MRYVNGDKVILYCPLCSRSMYVGINLNIPDQPKYFAECPSSTCDFLGYRADALEDLKRSSIAGRTGRIFNDFTSLT